MNKIVTGKNVFLRPLEQRDSEKMYTSLQNEEGRYMTGTKTTFSREKVIEAVQSFIEDSTRQDFAICLKDTGEMIGDLSILEIDTDNLKAMFRIAIHQPDYYGKGLGTEATQLAQYVVFERLKLNRLELQVYSHNQRGIRSYEKSGFVQEGRLRQALRYNGEFSDEVIMALLQEDYERPPYLV